MDFDHVGKNCAHSLCRQKDFLPFICDACNQSFCLEHRSYLAHNCGACGGKDMTSLDCPVCGKSVKFTKAQDPNLIWEDHYLKSCSQILPNRHSDPKLRCDKVGCKIILGPSNTIVCRKCSKQFCIAHRMCEDHNCNNSNSVSNNNQYYGTSFPALKNIHNNKHEFSYPKQNKVEKKNKGTVDPSNTVRGTIERRMKEPSFVGINTQEDTHTCPFCSNKYSTLDDLHTHIAIIHNESDVDSASSALDEVCPLCNLRLPSTNALINHCEREHPNLQQQQSGQSGAGCLVS